MKRRKGLIPSSSATAWRPVTLHSDLALKSPTRRSWIVSSAASERLTQGQTLSGAARYSFVSRSDAVGCSKVLTRVNLIKLIVRIYYMYVLPQCWLTTTRVRVSSTSLRRSTNAVLAFLVARQLRTWVIDPSSTLYYRWLGVISAACLYNLIMIIARAVFWKLQEGHLLTTWL